MRANRKVREYTGRDSAEVGIGTMIVFIATVLVAAVAAAVLIDTSGKLQEKSSRTGQEATDQVSSNLNVESMVGKRDTASDTGLDDLDIYISLAPGASNIDMSQLEVQLLNDTEFKAIDYVDAAADIDNFNVTEVRDADNSFTSAKPVMTAGDLVKITLDIDQIFGANEGYEPRERVTVVLIPEVGNKVVAAFTTPASYGTSTIVDLK